MRGIIGTAGHIDHGKTALIGALTGEDTDRLPEEHERGISIDLGFTRLDTPVGPLGVVDVPGHEDFIRNMLAGATGIDVLLLVVAADEGVMPQTREHVAIAELLGVHSAVVALSKADLVDDAWLGLVRDDVATFLAATPFEDAPMIPTSTEDGTGVEEVRQAIADGFPETRGAEDDLFRLPVDRSFSVRGTGTVVTGTVWSGSVATDATVRVLPGEQETRVRGLQVHGEDVDRVTAGQRAALALVGVDRDAVGRGAAVVTGAGWSETRRLTTSLRVLPGTRWRIEPWQRVRVHLGTAEVMARAVLLDRDLLEPGRQGLVQLRLEAPLVARSGDRFVIRSYSPVTTIGGGVVIEPIAPKRTGVGPGDEALFAALLDDDPVTAVGPLIDAAAGAGVAEPRVPVDTGVPPADVARAIDEIGAARVGDRAFAADAVVAVRDRVLDAVDARHERRPLQPGADPEAVRRAAADGAAESLVDHVIDALLDDGVLVMRRGRLARPDFRPTPTAEQAAVRERIRTRIADAGVAAPRLDDVRTELDVPDELLEDLVELMAAEEELTRLEHDLYVDSAVLRAAVREVRTRLGGRDGLSPGDFRDVLKVSRRHLIPLLEHFDRTGITVRTGGGRRVPEPDAAAEARGRQS